jgi:DNA-3-methyladenine glycosylase I
MTEPKRCDWCGSDPLYVAYHDTEWGVPVRPRGHRSDRVLFEFLILEGAQAGLSWLTILRKRENYRKALANFDPQRVAKFTDRDLDRLMNDPGIVRNRLKVQSCRANARVFIEIQRECGSFSEYWWNWVDGRPIVNRFRAMSDIPAKTELSDRISKDLKKRGMNFVGSTIIYAMMQATGMVNDHLVKCFRHKQVME